MAKVDIPGGSVPLTNPLAGLISGFPDLRRGRSKKAGDNTRAAPAREGDKTPFTRLLEGTGETAEPRELPPSEEAVQELLDDVHIAGDNLKNRPFPEEILAYKRAVRNFLHHVVEYGYAVEQREGIPNYQKPGYKRNYEDPDRKKRSLYTQVRVVDQKLEQLAAGILSGQINQMELLARVEEITGILIDLLQ
jgi:uncharacterized protein YaaR (DUF327 family)